MAEARVFPEEHFDDLEQQFSADKLGMWTFLATEILFFGGLILSYIVHRYRSPNEFQIASHHLVFQLGAVNTAVLLCSSLTMALAVRAAQLGNRRTLALFLCITMVFGLAFLGIKGTEYSIEWHEGLVPGSHFTFVSPTPDIDPRRVELFFYIYFAMTGLHAVHMLIGLCVLGTLTMQALKGRYTSGKYVAVELAGLYWHFVDIIWIFLFPMLYLIGHHKV